MSQTQANPAKMEQTAAAGGAAYLAIPGPSVIPNAVLQAMHCPSPNIYEGELIDITASILPDLKQVARTKKRCAIYIGNGHCAWEAALVNVLNEGERVLATFTGRFGHGWSEMAEALGLRVDALDFGNQSTIDIGRVHAALAADKSHEIKAVLAVHVDTSTSVRNDIAALRRVLDDLQHPALLMVDCIASLGCDRFEMDAWGVDVMVAACQKGLMVPAGMAFVFFNEKAAQARQSVRRVGRYMDWVPRADPQVYYQHFCGTAPTHHLFGLRAALDMIHAEGIENIWSRHETLARSIWAACDKWAEGGALKLNLSDPAIRSHAVTSLSLPSSMGTQLREWVQAHLGLTLGIGLGMGENGGPSDSYFRFGHMGHVNGQMIMGLLGGVQTGLQALNIPHGSGAIEAAAKVLGEAEGEVNK